jgi:RNA polymerase sigma-70 factor (ECF subfamily)
VSWSGSGSGAAAVETGRALDDAMDDAGREHADVARLMERLAAGDRDAFTVLVKSYQQKVFVMAYSILRDKEDAMDVVQETFLRLYRKASTYRPGGNLQGWLLRITKNLSIDHYRRHIQKRKEWESPASLSDIPVPVEDRNMDSRDSDLRSVFARCVERLAERQKMVFILRHYNELQFNEISTAMDISVGTAKSLHFKAVQNLRKWLTPYLGMTS